jgi:hypothetical protein
MAVQRSKGPGIELETPGGLNYMIVHNDETATCLGIPAVEVEAAPRWSEID